MGLALGFAGASPPAADAAGSIPGHLIAVGRVGYDCVEECLPSGYFGMAVAGPQRRFRLARPSGTESLATPLPPMISPNGRWLLYLTRRGRIVVRPFDAASLQAGGRRHLIGLSRAGQFDALPTMSWSPDSRRLVVAGAVQGSTGVWIVRRDGTRLRRIVGDRRVSVQGQVEDGQIPAWSRRGGIAFVGAASGQPPDDPGALAIWTVRPDGSRLRQITTPRPKPLGYGLGSFAADTEPAWSPDGQRLVFTHEAGSATGRLRIVDAATRKQRALNRNGTSGEWSPDGRSIAYVTPNNEVDVGVIPAAGGRGRRMTTPFDTGLLVDLDWRA